jgi:diacylglycerol kinase (ATP)
VRTAYVINPVAGTKKVEAWIDAIKRHSSQTEAAYALYMTEGPGDGVCKAKQAVKEGCDVVVAVGGDGTVCEVVNGIAGLKAILGILPVGTGNDFARILGIPIGMEKALKCLAAGKTRGCDLGMVNGRYFINVASVGFDAQVVIEAAKIKKDYPGPIAYILGVFKALTRHRAYDMHIVTDGRAMDIKATLIAMANGKFYGGGMKIAPEADLSDGLLDICIVRDMPRLKIAVLFPKIFGGTHINRPEVVYFRAAQIKIECNNGYINADGEITGGCPAYVSIEPGALTVIVP